MDPDKFDKDNLLGLTSEEYAALDPMTGSLLEGFDTLVKMSEMAAGYRLKLIQQGFPEESATMLAVHALSMMQQRALS